MEPQSILRGRAFWLPVAIAVTAWVGACVDERRVVGHEERRPAAWPGIVSDPVTSGTPAAPGIARSLAASSASDVVYVSLAPGTIPNGERALIRHRGAGSAVVAAMVAGGFDPVPVVAAVGDTLDIDVRLGGSDSTLHFSHVVAAARRPRVVRTDPPPRKRDVALNASIVVVFSEPIDPATLTTASVQLRTGTTPVAGQLEFRGVEHLTAAFVPDAPLAANATYTLVVTEGVRDLDGQPLEALVTVEFTTGLTTVEPLTGQIAFTSWGWAIRAMNADGFGARWLTNPPGSALQEYDSKPTWLSDGTKIAFVRGDGVFWWGEIYVMNADGSALTNLTNHSAYDWDPAWSPDGTRIAFASDRDDGRGEIYVMNADGSGVTRLTNDGSNPDFTWFDRWPTWSPDGTKIAFQRALVDSGAFYSSDIYVMSADGSGITMVAALGGDEQMPVWSPDGTKIAFVRIGGIDRGGGQPGIYVMNADGSAVTSLTNDGSLPHGYSSPTWSPGGTRIAFTKMVPLAGFPGSYEAKLYVMNADGSGVTMLNQPGGDNSLPAWSPR